MNTNKNNITNVPATPMNPLNAEMYRLLCNSYTNKRKCAYCGECDHTIRRCQHPSINALRYHLFFTLVQHSQEDQRSYLEAISQSTLKMICVLMNKSLSMTKIEAIQEILVELESLNEELQVLPMLRRPQKKIIINTIPFDPQENAAEKECPICFESTIIKNIFETNCKHTFCISCTHQHLKTVPTNPTCPMCRTELIELTTKQEITAHNRHLVGKQEYRIK